MQVTLSLVEPRKYQWPLHASKCWELANYYLKFNGWNVRILALEEEANSKGYKCTVELKIKEFGLCLKGVGSSAVDNYSFGTTQKFSYHRACENAFSQVGLLLLPDGKVAQVVAVKQTSIVNNSSS